MQKCFDKQHAAQQAEVDLLNAEHKTCDEAVTRRLQERRLAEQACTAEGHFSACTALVPKELATLCFSRCADERDATMQADVSRAQNQCEQEYVESKGKGSHECHVDGPLAAKENDTPAREERLKEDLTAAMQKKDAGALDLTLHQIEAIDRLRRQQSCTSACKARGPDLYAVSKQASGLITAYKRCMVAADSTREARKLAAYERDLYCDLLERANARCRTASRCDWLETYMGDACLYSSPDTDDCNE